MHPLSHSQSSVTCQLQFCDLVPHAFMKELYALRTAGAPGKARGALVVKESSESDEHEEEAEEMGRSADGW